MHTICFKYYMYMHLNPSQASLCFLPVCNNSQLKTVWGKGKVARNMVFSTPLENFPPFSSDLKIFVCKLFLLSLNIFYSSVLDTNLTLSQTSPGFYVSAVQVVTSNFSFSHIVFYSFREPDSIFIKIEIVVCKLFQFERV